MGSAAREIAQWLKTLTTQTHNDSSLDPRTRDSLGEHGTSQARDKEFPCAGWLGRLAMSGASGLIERPCLHEERKKSTCTHYTQATVKMEKEAGFISSEE